MATIIFDLDDTLINTHLLKESVADKLFSYGIPRDIVDSAYHIAKERAGNYTLQAHVDVIREKHSFEIPEDVFVWFSTEDLSVYVFPEYETILETLRENHTLILLTKGEAEFQKMKIAGSGLGTYFQHIHITPYPKEVLLSREEFELPIVFVNDKKEENEKIKELFTDFQIVEHHTAMNAKDLMAILGEI
jgi:FMN phosphatase YigB (HAD superfamily)